MKRLMTTAATIIALSTSAHAQGTGGAFTEYQVQPGQDLFASELMGSRLYATEGEVSGPIEADQTSEWNDLGEINDIVLSEDGSVEVVVVGIGGFLGIGERDAAVSMDELQIVRDSEDESEFYLVVNSTQEEIENAPEFTRGSETEQPNAGTGTGIAPEQAEPGAENIHQNLEETGQNMAVPAENIGNTAEDAADTTVQEVDEAVQDTGQAAERATSNN